jgi:hypothetical protein
MKALGLTPLDTPSPLNLFMNIPVANANTLSSAARQRAWSQKLSPSASEILMAVFDGAEYHKTLMHFDGLL